MRSVAIKMLYQLAYFIRVGLPSTIKARLSGASTSGSPRKLLGKYSSNCRAQLLSVIASELKGKYRRSLSW